MLMKRVELISFCGFMNCVDVQTEQSPVKTLIPWFVNYSLFRVNGSTISTFKVRHLNGITNSSLAFCFFLKISFFQIQVKITQKYVFV